MDEKKKTPLTEERTFMINLPNSSSSPDKMVLGAHDLPKAPLALGAEKNMMGQETRSIWEKLTGSYPLSNLQQRAIVLMEKRKREGRVDDTPAHKDNSSGLVLNFKENMANHAMKKTPQHDANSMMKNLVYAKYTDRVKAQLIDLGAYFVIYFLQTKFQLFFSAEMILDSVYYDILNFIYAYGMYALFYSVVIFFLGSTFGKYIYKLIVCDEYLVPYSVQTLIQRELIFKPLSYLSVLGICLVYINKHRQALHDILCETYVMSDPEEYLEVKGKKKRKSKRSTQRETSF